MKKPRIAILLILSLALLAGAIYWSRLPAGFATPDACVEAYAEACQAGDGNKYLTCLGEPLRSETQTRFSNSADLADALRRSMDDVKSWTQILEPVSEGAQTQIKVDQVRASGTLRVRFHLERSRGGWLIVGIDPPTEVPTPIPYGTHVRDAGDKPNREMD